MYIMMNVTYTINFELTNPIKVIRTINNLHYGQTLGLKPVNNLITSP